ncbi:hypothetical protein [Nocardia asiatica]
MPANPDANFMLGFSDREPSGWGPHRLSRDDITDASAQRWRIDSLEPAVIEILPTRTARQGVSKVRGPHQRLTILIHKT